MPNFSGSLDYLKLWGAAASGNVEKAKQILLCNPTINIHWKNDFTYDPSRTILSAAFSSSWLSTLLLAHPTVDINTMIEGSTPFERACQEGLLPLFRWLLKDSACVVDWKAIPVRNLDHLKYWIASGRGDDKVEMTREGWIPKEVDYLLKKCRENPVQTRDNVRRELGITGMLTSGSRRKGKNLAVAYFFFIVFPVTQRPKLTLEQFLSFLDGKAITTTGVRFLSSPPPLK